MTKSAVATCLLGEHQLNAWFRLEHTFDPSSFHSSHGFGLMIKQHSATSPLSAGRWHRPASANPACSGTYCCLFCIPKRRCGSSQGSRGLETKRISISTYNYGATIILSEIRQAKGTYGLTYEPPDPRTFYVAPPWALKSCRI